MLVITRKLGEAIAIGDNITLTVVDVRGDKVRLGVTCPAPIPVYRQEVHQAIHGAQPPPRPPEEMAFVQAVLETPDDEGIRLIFADWLEERGDPWGEFIRVQCRLAGLPAKDERRRDLQARERALWAEHGEKWRSYLPPVLRSSAFERGFVESVHLHVADFLVHAEEIFAAAPVRRLRVRWQNSVAALVASGFLARLTELDLGGVAITDNDVTLLAASPHVASLRCLVLRNNAVGDAGAAALARSPHLGNLLRLDLSGNRIGQAGAAVLRARFGERAQL
jgi:carbon storage regulator CsrA